MSNIAKLVGERIRTLRQERGLSQEQLALKASLNTSFIGQIERGGKKPTILTLDKIVTALDITFEELFRFENIVKVRDTTIIDKIVFELNGRTAEEQEDLYFILKKMIQFRDKR